jgi:hypothetical protein
VITSVRIFRNGVTMAIRSVSRARISAASSAPGGGAMSDTASSDSRSWRRDTIASIDSHTCSRVSSLSSSVTLNSTSTAAASRAECLASLGCRRARSLSTAASALPSSSVAISRSSNSRQSSTDRASR